MSHCHSTTASTAPQQGEINSSGPTLFSREEACAYLRCSIRTLQVWLGEGKLSFTKVGKRVWLTKADLDQFILHQNP